MPATSSRRVASARQVFFGDRLAPTDQRARLESSFFKSLCLPNGTHKTTAPSRLTDVDEVVCAYFQGRKELRLLDVGISSGATTLELLTCLDRHGTHARGVGVDICVRAVLRSCLGLDVLYDPAGHVLQVATPLFARGRPDRSQRSPRSKLLGAFLSVLEAAPVRWLLRAGRSRPIDLVIPRLLDRPDFKVVEHDAALPRQEWDGSFQLVRAANVLNRDYFAPSHILKMVGNLITWLEPGGVLVICSTRAADGSNHGSLYRKQGAAPWLRPLRHLGAGYELAQLIEATYCGGPGPG